jgi:serine/threonine protein kinase
MTLIRHFMKKEKKHWYSLPLFLSSVFFFLVSCFSGYISPEFATRGFFSVKSDVFSFGVIILETISGKKNRDYCDYDDLDLLGYVSLRI